MLNTPIIYEIVQFAVGAKTIRKELIKKIIEPAKPKKILDLGCGTGYVLKYLPPCQYTGVDINKKYIQYAKSKFKKRKNTAFQEKNLNSKKVLNKTKYDCVMMNGLLHHLKDSEASNLLEIARRHLKKEGLLVGIDGCYEDKLSFLSKYLLSKDRGKYIREAEEYKKLMKIKFRTVSLETILGPAWFPYNYCLWFCKKRKN